MTQLSLADAADGMARQAAGRERMERIDTYFMARVREQAKVLSERDGSVTTDTLRLWAVGQGLYPKHQNSWGTVLRGSHWSVIGRTRSALPSNHAREIRIYRWRD